MVFSLAAHLGVFLVREIGQREDHRTLQSSRKTGRRELKIDGPSKDILTRCTFIPQE